MCAGSAARRALLLLFCAGPHQACRQDMHDQPRYRPLRPSDFFEDGRSARPPIPGTVSRSEIPIVPGPIDEPLLLRGQGRFDIFCSPCHGRLGDGQGMVVRRGVQRPPSFHGARLRGLPIEHYVDVITNGYGAMMSYAAQVPLKDRWAIGAYIKALQLSRHATLDDVPLSERSRLDTAPQSPPTFVPQPRPPLWRQQP